MGLIHTLKSRLLGEPDGEQFMTVPPAKSTAQVVMYSTRFCPYCVRAKSLLSGKGIHFRDIAVDNNIELRKEMTEKSGKYTVPQIWIGDTHVGGCDELMQLEHQGRLDNMLLEIDGHE